MQTLAGWLRAAGHHVLLLDPLLTGQSEDRTARRAAAYQPDLVGLCVMSAADLPSALALGCAVERARPGVQVVVGGNLVSTEPRVACHALPAGWRLIRYEGERALGALLDPRAAPSQLPGAVLRSPDGAYQGTVTPQPLEELDRAPLAARDLSSLLVERGQAVNIQGARGCAGACDYCSSPGFPYPGGKRWRGRSPQRVVEELAQVNAHTGAQLFNFVDDDFFGPRAGAAQRAHELARLIGSRRLRIAFSIQARPGAVTPQAASDLAGAGLAYAFVGLESLTPGRLQAWGRHPGAADPWAPVRALQSVGVTVQVGFIPFHPAATVETIAAELAELRQHGQLNLRTAANRLLAVPGAALWRRQQDQHGDKLASGPAPVPLPEQLEQLHRDLQRRLAPLRADWLQAACAWPAATLARKALGPQHQAAQRVAGKLQQRLDQLDRQVWEAARAALDQL